MSTYYPVGTIVKLTLDEDALFMIAGYLTKYGDGPTRDYFAVPFPFGLMKLDQALAFNHSRITEVVHEGYRDDECETLLGALDQMSEKIRKFVAEKQSES